MCIRGWVEPGATRDCACRHGSKTYLHGVSFRNFPTLPCPVPPTPRHSYVIAAERRAVAARFPLAVEEDSVMSHLMLRRIVTAGALAALLALSLPAAADARELGGTDGMLRWLNR